MPRPGRARPSERTQRWRLERDAECYGAAADVDATHGRWWVLYAPYWGTYDAYWLGPEVLPPLRQDTPHALRRAMAKHERRFTAPPAAHWRVLPHDPGSR